MPLPAALQARLAKRGIIQKGKKGLRTLKYCLFAPIQAKAQECEK